MHDQFLKIGIFLGRYKFARALTRQLFDYQHLSLKQGVAGISFENPVGLSAGFDKDGNLLNIIPELGFGYAQIGTITFKPYKGNPKPRLYRLPKSKAIVVYYGLKGEGVKKVLVKIKRARPSLLKQGISIGKTNAPYTKSMTAGVKDYTDCLREVIKSGVGDFYTINISCPNTFGGEPFGTPEKLEKLLKKLATLKYSKPLFLKMPIDLPWPEFDKLLKVSLHYNVTGVVIGNVTKARDKNLIKDVIPENVRGGISGRPTWERSNMLISKTYQKYGKKLVIVGVGGIFSAEDAYEKIQRGASLVQVITGMIYEGPQLIGEINRGLVKRMKRDGFKTIGEVVGTKTY